MTEHEHKWQTLMHLDGCHFYTSSYRCSCGATATRTDERDPKYDPYSMIWMEPMVREVRRDERGRFVKPRLEEVVCARCRELEAGAKTKHDLVIVAKNGDVIEEKHEEHEQREADADDEDE
ncbi:MAG TPA: hypothetical protein VGG82_07880 [Casimicrobiaceae bacterium]|jgi:hypothetical protein